MASSSSDEDNYKSDLAELRKTSTPLLKSAETFGNNEDVEIPDVKHSPIRRRAGTDDSDQPIPDWEILFGFHTSLLADILTPRSALCGQKFELEVDDLTFLGHPVHAKRGMWRRTKRSAKRTKTKTNGAVGLGIGLEEDADDELQDGGHSSEDENEEMNASMTSHGTKVSPSLSATTDNSTADPAKSGQMTLFHVVFVLDTPEHDRAKKIDTMYRKVATKLTAALKHQQQRNDYVGREAESILAMKERASAADMSYNELMALQLEHSDLARILANVYNAISSDQIAYLLINNEIELALQIPPPAPNVLHLAIDDEVNGMINDLEEEPLPILEPFHTLLLPQDLQEVYRDLPLDAESNLIKLCQFLEPTISLAQMPAMLGCTLDEVFEMASHLLYWRKAKLINVVGIKNIYVVNPEFDFSNILNLSVAFAEAFPTLPSIVSLLSMLYEPRTFASLCPSKDHRGIYLEVLIWMLRHDLLRQLFTFIRICVPTSIKEMVAEEQAREEVDPGPYGLTHRGFTSSSESPASRHRSREVSPSSRHSSARSPSSSRASNGGRVSDDDLDLERQQQKVSAAMKELSLAPAPTLLSASERRRRSRGSSISSAMSPTKEVPSHSAKSSMSQPRVSRSRDRTSRSQSQSRARSRSRQRQMEREGGLGVGTGSLIDEPGQATALEHIWLERIVSQKLETSPSAAALFERIKPFLNGRHSVEEIIFSQGLRRRDMKELLRAFNTELVKVLHY